MPGRVDGLFYARASAAGRARGWITRHEWSEGLLGFLSPENNTAKLDLDAAAMVARNQPSPPRHCTARQSRLPIPVPTSGSVYPRLFLPTRQYAFASSTRQVDTCVARQKKVSVEIRASCYFPFSPTAARAASATAQPGSFCLRLLRPRLPSLDHAVHFRGQQLPLGLAARMIGVAPGNHGGV